MLTTGGDRRSRPEIGVNAGGGAVTGLQGGSATACRAAARAAAGRRGAARVGAESSPDNN
jgi:hypothetical protein